MLLLNVLIPIVFAGFLYGHEQGTNTSRALDSPELTSEILMMDAELAKDHIASLIFASYMLRGYDLGTWAQRSKVNELELPECPESEAHEVIAETVKAFYQPMYEGDDLKEVFIWSAQKGYYCEKRIGQNKFANKAYKLLLKRAQCVREDDQCEKFGDDEPSSSTKHLRDCGRPVCRKGLQEIRKLADSLGYPSLAC